MERQRVLQALSRIEAAAARIEAAARNRAASVPAGGDLELAAKHAELRASVGASLRELDTLIGSLEHG